MMTARRRTFLAGVGSLGVIGLVGATRPRGRIQTVSDCTIIDEPGEYRLDRDIVHHMDDEPCIHITADDVVFDGDGYFIENHTASGTSVVVTGDNVVVENVSTGTLAYGIEYRGVQGGEIRNCETQSERGMFIVESEDVLVRENILRDDLGGIRIRDCVKCRVADNRLFSCDRGIGISGGKDNSSARNFLLYPYYGIGLSGFRNRTYRDEVIGAAGGAVSASGPYARILKTTVFDTVDDGYSYRFRNLDRLVAIKCIARSNEADGFLVEDARNVTLDRCQSWRNDRAGFHLRNVHGGTIVRNVAEDNNGEPFRIEDSTGLQFERNDPPIA